MAGEEAISWRIRPPDELVWREVADEVIVLDLRTSMYSRLNGSASVLWMALAEGATTSELARRLEEEFGVETEVAKRDTNKFLASCHDQDLLQPPQTRNHPPLGD